MRKLLSGLEVAPGNHGLLVTINFAFLINGITVVMLGVILPHVRAEHSLSYTQSGLMLSAHQTGTLAAVFIAGILPYMIDRKKSTLIMSAGTILGLPLIVMAQNPWLLLAAFALVGIDRGTMNNISNFVAADISGNKTAALNVLHSAFAAGALISPFIVFLYVSAAGSAGWKLSALTAALLTMIAWALMSRSKFPDASAQKGKGVSYSFIKHSSFWIPTLLLFCYVAAEASIIGWFVLYFIDDGILPAVLAGFVPTMYWMMILVARIVIAAVSKNIHNKNRMLLVLALLALLCFTGLVFSSSPIPCVIFLLGIGLSMAGIYPTTVATMSGVSSTVSLGLTIAIATLGGIFMPGIIGVVADSYGIANGIAMLYVTFFGMIALIVFKIITERRSGNETC